MTSHDISTAPETMRNVSFAVVDFETTGLNPETDRIVQLATVIINGDGDIIDSFETIVKPENPGEYQHGAEHIHGITAEQVANGMPLRIALEKAKNFILTGSIATTTAMAGAEGGLTTATLGTTTAMKLLRGALIATGIGALIVLIGTLIANFDKVTAVVQKMSGYVVKAYDYFDNLGTSVKVLIGIFFPLDRKSVV
jgi:hypothetical protein